MDSLQIRRHHSRNTLLLLVLFTVAVLGLLFWNLDFINKVYFREQLTPTGLVINGTIAALFLLGMINIVISLAAYVKEEAALRRFMTNIENDEEKPLQFVEKNTLISNRYKTMATMYDYRTPINQSALASTLVASESTRNNLPRFINNILILTGVFGTIVSLSLALMGASDMLENSVEVGGMGMVIHGMSTALSTTITAIVCYLFFGFFLMKLNDVQTNLISAIEQITATYLMPRFQVQNENALYEFTGLISSLQGLVREIEQSQRKTEKLEKLLADVLDDNAKRATTISEEMSAIKNILKHGFRLSDD